MVLRQSHHLIVDLFPLTVRVSRESALPGNVRPLILACSLRRTREILVRLAHMSARVAYRGARAFLNHMLFHTGGCSCTDCSEHLPRFFFQVADLGSLFFSFLGDHGDSRGVLLFLLGLMLSRVGATSRIFGHGCHSPVLLMAPWFPSLVRSGRLFSRMALGCLTGFLPCCLLWAMVVTAAATRDPLKGFFTMVLFGLGTMPILLLTALPPSFLSSKTRLLAERAAAAYIVVMGLILILKGAGIID